jgi:hypothetical protein
MAFGEIVKYRDTVSGIEQFLNAVGTDISGAASYKYIHVKKIICPAIRHNRINAHSGERLGCS